MLIRSYLLVRARLTAGAITALFVQTADEVTKSLGEVDQLGREMPDHVFAHYGPAADSGLDCLLCAFMSTLTRQAWQARRRSRHLVRERVRQV